MAVIDPNNLDLVAAMLTSTAVNRCVQHSQEPKNLDYEFQLVVENYYRMRSLLKDEDERLSMSSTSTASASYQVS
jgi:hypothetical protein